MRDLFYPVLLTSSIASAQLVDTTFWNSAMMGLAASNSRTGWIHMKAGRTETAATFFTGNKSAFGLSLDDEMIVLRAETDELEHTHYRFQQMYKGIKVEGAEYIVHVKDELVMSANGVLVKGIDRSSVAMISESSALSTALASLDATGRRVLELAPQGAPTTILQVEGLAPASYFLVAVDILGMVHNRKLIKQ